MGSMLCPPWVLYIVSVMTLHTWSTNLVLEKQTSQLSPAMTLCMGSVHI